MIARATPEELAAVRDLFTEYAASIGISLAYQDFDRELAELPGAYAPPSGALLVARHDGAFVGCVAMRRIDATTCEMKRLYVRRPGLGIGRELAAAIVEEARSAGYRCMRLDTLAESMAPAIALYRSMGFVEIAPYYPSPQPGTMYMELTL